MTKQTQNQKTNLSAPAPNNSAPVDAVSAPVVIQTPERKKELHYTRMETSKIDQKVKVQFTSLSSRNGDETELDYGLAKVYEKQGKVKIII